MGFGGDAGMQRKPGHLAHRVVERLLAGQGLQGKDLAARLRPHRDAVGDRVGQERIHRPLVHRPRGQIALLAVALQQSLPLQKAPDPPGDGVRQFGELGGGRGPHPAKPLDRSTGPHDIDPIQEPSAKIVALPRVGGLHHRYVWAEAA